MLLDETKRYHIWISQWFPTAFPTALIPRHVRKLTNLAFSCFAFITFSGSSSHVPATISVFDDLDSLLGGI